MKQVEYWRWLVTDPIRGNKYKTRYTMDEATALQRHPDAVRVPGTMELREVLEPGDVPLANTKPR